jgi:predicted RNase H-like HicB family nuclease
MAETFINLTVRIEPADEDETGFVAVSPELGIASQGETIEEALDSVKEAIEEFLDGLNGEGGLIEFLQAKGIEVYSRPPERTTVEMTPGEIVSAFTAAVGDPRLA